MNPATHERRFPRAASAALAATIVSSLLASNALAVQTTPPQAPAASAAPAVPFWATVNGDNVMLRSAATVQGTYPFGRLFTGQPVKVIETDYGWSKVQAVGPTFATLFGFVKASNATQYDAATKKLSVLSKTSLTAPNMDAKFAPDKSWRELIVLAEGDTLDVVEEVKAQSDTYYSVRLPSKAFGWVSSQFITPMSQQEADSLEASLTGAAPQPQGQATPAGGAAPTAAPPAATPSTPPSNPQAPATQTPTATGAGTGPAPAPPATPPAAGQTTGTTPPAETTPKETEEEAAARRAAEKARLEREVRRATYADLEATWAVVRKQAAEEAELGALRERYVALIEDELTPAGTRALARARAEQLALRIEAQEALLELASQRASMENRTQSIADLELALLKRRSFDAVGRLSASTVYDGTTLPLLYKLADPATGRTIAYVMPGPTTKPSEALGLLVGLKGRKRYDETLRVDLFEPELIEVLDTSKSQVIERSPS